MANRAMDLVKGLRNHRPRLLFLSACHSAAQNSSETADETNNLSLSLLGAGMLAVLGWGDSVGDGDASLFAAHLYRELAQGADLEKAVGQARFDLLNQESGQPTAQDWHLA